MCTSQEKAARPNIELANVFRLHGDDYCKNNTLTPEQYKVIHAIKNCRTDVLGGHAEQCDHCAEIQYAYNSCRNRHCPKCETFKAAQWLAARQTELLPVPYFHVVFTLPHELNNLVLYNKRLLYDLLFQASWQTLKKLGADPKRLKGEVGALSILHTWGQTLTSHNHVHCIVPGGALKRSGQWQPTKKFLFPVKVMSKLFRGIYITKLGELFRVGQLKLPDKQLTAANFDSFLNNLMRKDWVVYAKKPFAGPEQLLNYLCRYTHKIAISNHRILSCDEQSVTFKWRDYNDGNKEKVMSLKPQEFIRRFLSHVVPPGFQRIRSNGFLANACKATKLEVIRKSLKQKPPKVVKKRDAASLMLALTGVDITICPHCKQGKLQRIATLPSKFGKTVYDTS